MSKVLALSEATYERLRALAQERECTPEELIHTLLVDAEQAQYYHMNQQMLAQGYSRVHSTDPRECRSGIYSGQDSRPAAVADDLG